MGSTVAIIPSSITLLASHSNNSAGSYSCSLLPWAAPVARPSPLPRRRFAGRPRAPAMSAAFKAFLNSPVGPKTTHFWGPVSNWGIILAVRITITGPSARGSICVAGAAISVASSRRGDLELEARVASPPSTSSNTTRLMDCLTLTWVCLN